MGPLMMLYELFFESEMVQPVKIKLSIAQGDFKHTWGLGWCVG